VLLEHRPGVDAEGLTLTLAEGSESRSNGGARGSDGEVFIAECRGYTDTEALTPESLRDNWGTVTDREGYEVPSAIAEETAMYLKALS